MVARTQSAPSSRWGMNSPPMKGTSSSDTAKMSAARRSLSSSGDQDTTPADQRIDRAPIQKACSRARERPFLNQYAHSTGTRVSVRMSAPTSAMATVSAIGLNSFPEGPLSA